MAQRTPLPYSLVQRRRPELQSPRKSRPALWNRFRHRFHLRLHQYRYLPAVPRVPMLEERRCVPARRAEAYFRRSGAALLGEES